MDMNVTAIESEKSLVSTLVRNDFDYDYSETIVKKYTVDINKLVSSQYKGTVTFSPKNGNIEITIVLYFSDTLAEDYKELLDEIHKRSDDLYYLHTNEKTAVTHSYPLHVGGSGGNYQQFIAHEFFVPTFDDEGNSILIDEATWAVKELVELANKYKLA